MTNDNKKSDDKKRAQLPYEMSELEKWLELIPGMCVFIATTHIALHSLTYDGKDPNHQADVVWRYIDNGETLVADTMKNEEAVQRWSDYGYVPNSNTAFKRALRDAFEPNVRDGYRTVQFEQNAEGAGVLSAYDNDSVYFLSEELELTKAEQKTLDSALYKLE